MSALEHVTHGASRRFRLVTVASRVARTPGATHSRCRAPTPPPAYGATMNQHTTAVVPTARGSRRSVPSRPSPEQRQRLQDLLDQEEHWVLRGDWELFLDTGSSKAYTPLSRLTREHRVAVTSWLRQQRHALHHAIEGGVPAPGGWIESLRLYDALTRR